MSAPSMNQKSTPRRIDGPSYPSWQERNQLAGALGVPMAGLRGGIDPIYYAFAGMPYGGQNLFGMGGRPRTGGNGTGGTGTGGTGTGPTPPTPWQAPTLMQTPLPYSLGPDWRQTMMSAVFPRNR